MAIKPTPGGSDGTYGTELNAFLDESLASDGKIKDGAVLAAATEAADGDRTITDLASVRSAGFPDVNGSPTAVFTKYFSGTTDAATSTSVTHGITGIDNILHVSAAIQFNGGNYTVSDKENTGSGAAAQQMSIAWGASNVSLSNLGTGNQSQKYKIKIDFIL